MKTRSLKPLWVVLIVVAALLLLAIIVGVLNALIGGGKWTFGWSNYRYDETGFSVGGGTVYDLDINNLELDWVKGSAEVIVSEDDTYVSVSESSAEELDETAQLRWKVENGTLTVKFRESGRFFTGGAQEKHLIVRIPQKIAGQMKVTTVNAVSADVKVIGITAENLTVTGVSGSVTLTGCIASKLEINTVGGNVSVQGSFSEFVSLNSTGGNLKLMTAVCPVLVDANTVGGNVDFTLPADASFRLDYSHVGGVLVSDFVFDNRDDELWVGDGTCRMEVSTVGGNLTLRRASEVAG